MTFLDFILTFFAFTAAAMVLRYCLKRRTHARSSIGIAVSIFTLLYCATPFFRYLQVKNSHDHFTNLVLLSGSSDNSLARSLPTRFTGSPLQFDLSISGKSVSEALTMAEKSNRLIIFQAAGGILPEYDAWVKKEFGSYRENTEKDVLICFRRVPELPYATGICQRRTPRYFFEPSVAHGFAGTQNGIGMSVLLKHQSNARYAISTMNLEGSPEEFCLKELSRGSACAGIELLPEGTLSALLLDVKDPEQRAVFDEFRIPLGFPRDSLPIDSFKGQACGGYEESKSAITYTQDRHLQESLEKVKTEIELSEALQISDELLSCPGPSALRVPLFHYKDAQPATRSFLTQLEERPFWFTTPESYLERVKKIKQVKLSGVGQTIQALSPEDIRKFAMTILTPVTFNEEVLRYLKADIKTEEYKIYRTGTTAFRLTSRILPDAPLLLDASPILNTGGDGNSSVVSDWTGFNRALLFALALALMVSWLQCVATEQSEHQAFAPLTFFYIAFIGLVWSFLSYRASLLGSQGVIAETQLERGGDTQFITFRDWDENWWKHEVEVKEERLAVSASQSASWRAEVAASKKISIDPATLKDKLKILDLNRDAAVEFKGQVHLVLWDAPEIRNWYFRKSPAYASTLTAWQAEFQLPGISGETKTDPSLNFSALPAGTILMVPDFSLLSEPNLEALGTWVKGGGTVVFHDHLDPSLSDRPTTTAPFSMKEWKRVEYSKIASAFKGLIEVNRPHFVHQTSKAWYQVQASGSGRMVFLGVIPAQTGSASLIQEMLFGLSGAEASISTVSQACSSALLIQPYGADNSQIQGLVQKLRSAHVSYNWALDAESFARMAPEWRNSFTAKNTVYLDDGIPANRVYADELYRRFFKTTESPIFVTLNESLKKDEGPNSFILKANLLPGAEARENSISLWNSECYTGFARPRLLVAQDLKANSGFWLKAVNALNPGEMKTARELLESALSSKNNPEKKNFKSEYLRPLDFKPERISP